MARFTWEWTAPSERLAAAPASCIKTTLSSLQVRVVEEQELVPLDPQLNTFFNINIPEDLEKARAIAASEGT
jgi:molybdopterin-guanine dinucleotide biosynthesis protein A